MTRQNNGIYDPHWLRQGSPVSTTQPWSESFPRLFSTGDQAGILATGVMLSVALPLQQGDVVSNLTFVSGTTPANVPSHWWFALYDNSATPALLSQTADQTTTAWAANTVKKLALTAAQTITAPGIYYAAIMMAATTPVSLHGRSLGNAVMAGAIASAEKILVQTSGSALTTTAPSTITGATTTAVLPYCVAT